MKNIEENCKKHSEESGDAFSFVWTPENAAPMHIICCKNCYWSVFAHIQPHETVVGRVNHSWKNCQAQSVLKADLAEAVTMTVLERDGTPCIFHDGVFWLPSGRYLTVRLEPESPEHLIRIMRNRAPEADFITGLGKIEFEVYFRTLDKEKYRVAEMIRTFSPVSGSIPAGMKDLVMELDDSKGYHHKVVGTDAVYRFEQWGWAPRVRLIPARINARPGIFFRLPYLKEDLDTIHGYLANATEEEQEEFMDQFVSDYPDVWMVHRTLTALEWRAEKYKK